MRISGLSRHQYYYRKQGRKRGRKASAESLLADNSKIDNARLVVLIKQIQGKNQNRYGYQKMSYALKEQGVLINKKKVYRIMKENNLLQQRTKQSGKNYVKFRKVKPSEPLQVLEMDIKFVWVEQHSRHAYVLSVIDTFTRKVLYFTVQYSITKNTVKAAWEHIVREHLQPADLLKRPLQIEVRNDNDKRFSAKTVQDFFKENHLSQVFTHPYTPQENGHIESFHSILSRHLKPHLFWSLEQLEQTLVLFYEHYNNERIHSSIAFTSPCDFEVLWHKKMIEKKELQNGRKTVFKLLIPYHQIKRHTGKYEPKGSLLHGFEPLDEAKKPEKEKMTGADTSNNLRYKKSPSVVSCIANVETKNYLCNT